MLSLDKSRQQQFHDPIVGISLVARNGASVEVKGESVAGMTQ